jgi:hypothetical protein
MEPPADVVEGLGPDGERLVRAIYRECEVSGIEAAIARVAALSLDDAAAARRANDAKSARAAHRQFLAAMGRLGLPLFDRT